MQENFEVWAAAQYPALWNEVQTKSEGKRKLEQGATKLRWVPDCDLKA